MSPEVRPPERPPARRDAPRGPGAPGAARAAGRSGLAATGSARGARGGLRARLLASFLLPVLLLGLGGLLLLGLPGEPIGPRTTLRDGAVFMGLLAVTVLLATGLAIHMGDRVARPVAWLLRLMDAGQIRLLSKGPTPAADWEIEDLSRRVQVLLLQNLAGAGAMEELDALRSEVTAVLDAAVVGKLDPQLWPRERATHPQTRRLLDFFRVRADSLRDATQGLARLEKLLEQDWRAETRTVREIAERSERCFLGQTEMALELERLERLVRPSPAELRARAEAAQTLADLRDSFARWRGEVEAALDGTGEPAGASEDPAGAAERRRLAARVRAWSAWVEESLALLGTSWSSTGAVDDATQQRLSGGLEKVARSAADAGQQLGALSREAARLQQAWEPLGERLRSLLVRVAEVEAGPDGARSAEVRMTGEAAGSSEEGPAPSRIEEGPGSGNAPQDAGEGESRDSDA